MKKSTKILLIGLSTILYLWGLSFLAGTRQEAERVHILLQQALPAERAEEIFRREVEQEENVIPFCFWGQRGKETAFCKENGKAQSAEIVLVSGNPELFGAGALNWQRGCLIDRETAQTLFGTTDCGGQILYLKDRAYPVLGIVSAPRPTVVRLAEKGSGESLDRCIVFSTKAQAESFLVRWGLQGKILNFFPFWTIAADVSLLFPGILLGALCAFLSRGFRKLEFGKLREQLPLLIRTLLALILAVCGVIFLTKCLVIPEEMIPTKWSDFSFWGSLWQEQRDNFLTIAFTPLGNGQLQMIFSMIKSTVCSIVSACAALWVLTKRENVRRQDHADLAD